MLLSGSPMSGGPTFDIEKKQKRGEFKTPPRPTGRRSNKWQFKLIIYYPPLLIYVPCAPAAIGCVTSETQVRDRLYYSTYSISNKSTVDFITFCTMSQHYETDSPNSSTSSTSGMSSDISEDESVLGSEDIDAR